MAHSRKGKYGQFLEMGSCPLKAAAGVSSECGHLCTPRGLFPPTLGTKVSMSQCHYDRINQTLSYLSLMTRTLPHPTSILSMEIGALEAIYTSFVFLGSHMCTICPLLARCLRGSMNHTVILNYECPPTPWSFPGACLRCRNDCCFVCSFPQ